MERVHAVQNHALSNEQFSSTAIYPEYTKGDEKHKVNMEHMAEEVRRCLGIYAVWRETMYCHACNWPSGKSCF